MTTSGDAHEIVVSGLTKRFGATLAVDALSFSAPAGSVTGFIGPNGAGKSTTLRCILGLVAADAGTTHIGGQRYADLRHPLQTVGAALDVGGFHPTRTARNHLLVLCAAAGIPDRRADEVLEVVGLTAAADRRVGGFSTGMRQRLGLGTALLGDPSVLVLDEPATGLDPAGVTWLRHLLRTLAGDEGRTVLVSSHLLAELQHTADRIVIIAKGHLVREDTLADLTANGSTVVRVQTPEPTPLCDALSEAGLHPEAGLGEVIVRGGHAALVGHIAFMHGIELHGLTEDEADLEDVFLELTDAATEGAA